MASSATWKELFFTDQRQTRGIFCLQVWHTQITHLERNRNRGFVKCSTICRSFLFHMSFYWLNICLLLSLPLFFTKPHRFAGDRGVVWNNHLGLHLLRGQRGSLTMIQISGSTHGWWVTKCTSWICNIRARCRKHGENQGISHKKVICSITKCYTEPFHLIKTICHLSNRLINL